MPHAPQHRGRRTSASRAVPGCRGRRDAARRADVQFRGLARHTPSLPGGAHACLPDFASEAFLGAIENTRATVTLLTPTLLIRIIRSDRLGDFDISSLRRLTYGTAPMDPGRIRGTVEASPGVELLHAYGPTETSPILTTPGWNQHLAGLGGGDRLRSVGRPVIGFELCIADHEESHLPTGATGEIVVRGPNVSVG